MTNLDIEDVLFNLMCELEGISCNVFSSRLALSNNITTNATDNALFGIETHIDRLGEELKNLHSTIDEKQQKEYKNASNTTSNTIYKQP